VRLGVHTLENITNTLQSYTNSQSVPFKGQVAMKSHTALCRYSEWGENSCRTSFVPLSHSKSHWVMTRRLSCKERFKEGTWISGTATRCFAVAYARGWISVLCPL
jgi:hypothetical protein